MSHPAAFKVASSNVHSQIFDDEAVVMDMATGLYFSLRGAAVPIWAAIEAGAAHEAIAAALADRYEASAQAIADALATTTAALVEHALIVPADAATGAPPAGSAPRGPLEAPMIERFTDMQELLLLDPIHEVSEAGWPVARPADGD